MSIFSERLKQLRIENKLNQADVAAVIGVSVQSYSAYEASREPKYDILCKLAHYFSCTTDYLLGVSNAPNAEQANIIEKTIFSRKAVEMIYRMKNRQNDFYRDARALNFLIEHVGRHRLFSHIYSYVFEDFKFSIPSNDESEPESTALSDKITVLTSISDIERERMNLKNIEIKPDIIDLQSADIKDMYLTKIQADLMFIKGCGTYD